MSGLDKLWSWFFSGAAASIQAGPDLVNPVIGPAPVSWPGRRTVLSLHREVERRHWQAVERQARGRWSNGHVRGAL